MKKLSNKQLFIFSVIAGVIVFGGSYLTEAFWGFRIFSRRNSLNAPTGFDISEFLIRLAIGVGVGIFVSLIGFFKSKNKEE